MSAIFVEVTATRGSAPRDAGTAMKITLDSIDGTIGGECDGKWYGGCYGWVFTVTVPQTGALASRNTHHLGIAGFGNALGNRLFDRVGHRDPGERPVVVRQAVGIEMHAARPHGF